MQHYDASDLENMNNLFRANLINSCTGYKSANLIATKSNKGITNVAIFSSVTHIGSNPPILSFILRPTTVPRNTFKNLKATGVFTINHIRKNMISKAHQTSAKYDEGISEFLHTGLEEEYYDDFFAPYVKDSPIKLGCKYLNEYHIKENDTILVIAVIEHIYFENDIQMPDGWLQLDKAGVVAVNGLDAYAATQLLDRFHYARPEKEVKSLLAFDSNKPA